MIKTSYVKPIVFVLLLTWSASTFALNYNFLKNSVISEFRDSDITMFIENVRRSLNEDRKVSWHNEETGNGGDIVPTEKTTHQGLACRYLMITNKSRAQQATSRVRFCKDNDKWKVVPAGQ